MAVTLIEAQQLRASWFDALQAVSTGQEYQLSGRRLTRADASFCERMFLKWDNEVDRIKAGRRKGTRGVRIVPRDL